MHIAIDISPLQNEHQARGTGVYTECLISSLKEYIPNNSYTLITRGSKLPNTVDVVHYPYFEPFFLTLPHVKHTPTVVTVHDVIPLVYPDKFPRGLRGEIKWRIQKRALLASSFVITDSEASRTTIADYTTYPKDKISVVYLAPRELFRHAPARTQIESARNKYALPEKYLLYVGDINWNKNIPGLLRAFNLVKSKFPSLHLVLVGKAFLNAALPEAASIRSEISRLGIVENILTVGYLTDAELHVLYYLAGCYVQPSYAEGFGLPVLEAMAGGCPCVVSDNTSLSEIAGPSIKVNAHDPDSIASGIAQILSKDNSTLIRKGKEWVNNFTWRNVALQTNEVYKKVFSGSGGTV